MPIPNTVAANVWFGIIQSKTAAITYGFLLDLIEVGTEGSTGSDQFKELHLTYMLAARKSGSHFGELAGWNHLRVECVTIVM